MTREPEWDAEARAWFIALAQIESSECHRCGGDLHETTSRDNDGSNPMGKAHYLADPPVVCHHCLALARSAKAWAKDDRAPALIHTAKLHPRKPRKRRR